MCNAIKAQSKIDKKNTVRENTPQLREITPQLREITPQFLQDRLVDFGGNYGFVMFCPVLSPEPSI